MPVYEPKKGSPGYAAFNKIMKNTKDYPDTYDRYVYAIEADNRAQRAAKAKAKAKKAPAVGRMKAATKKPATKKPAAAQVAKPKAKPKRRRRTSLTK